MKKVTITIIILALFLIGCAKMDKETVKTQEKQAAKELSEADYKKKIKELTDKEICKMIVEDFDNNGIKEAFVLTRKNQDKEALEDEFELWFLTSDKSERISESFIGENSTSIELFTADEKYIIFNISQTRQNDEMKSFIYGIDNDEVIEMFSQKRLNLFLENNELYAYNSSYYVLEPEFKEWMSLAQQKYHFKWDDETKTCKEYCANVISEKEFMSISQSKNLKEIICERINEMHSKNVKDIEYEYLLREDNTVDVNMIVTAKDKVKYKYYTTVSYNDNILGTDIEIYEGNKEESLINYLKR